MSSAVGSIFRAPATTPPPPTATGGVSSSLIQSPEESSCNNNLGIGQSSTNADDMATTTKVTPQLMHKDSEDPLFSNAEVRRVELKDVQAFMKKSTLGLECVTQEQIERVRKMHDRFAEAAELSFNYNTLLLVASVLAGLGLAANSNTTLIASMLVSRKSYLLSLYGFLLN